MTGPENSNSLNAFETDGGCACGAVRFRLNAKPLFVHCCHCRWCQRESGSAFALNALIESNSVTLLSGRPISHAIPSESGKGQKLRRCESCRVILWSHYAGMGEAISFIRVGALDAPDSLPPDIHIYTASKQPWFKLTDGKPIMSEYYSKKEYWPESSLARWGALYKRDDGQKS